MPESPTLFGSPTKPEPIAPVEWSPRPYQQEAIDSAFGIWERHPGAIVRMATGMGKTATASFLAKRWIQQGDDCHVIVLCHETQLVQQWARELKKFTDFYVGVEQATKHVNPSSLPRIVVASRATLIERNVIDEEGRETINSRVEKFDNSLRWLVVVDEAHRYALHLRSCGHIFEHFEQHPGSRRLGLTATPERGDGVSLGTLFPGIAMDYRMAGEGRSAVNEGWAVPFDQRYVRVEGVDFTNVAEVAGDYSEADLSAILSEQETLASVCDPTIDLVGDRRTLIFSPTVDMARAVAGYLNAKVRPGAAKSLSGADNEEVRRRTFHQHQNGVIQFLSVCGLCKEGYDDPGIGVVAIFRPTKSRPLAEQMKGRGCRPLRGIVDGLDTAEERRAAIAASAKPTCMIVDLVGVTGLADCATTLDIYADGKPDEVVERAQQKLDDGETDIQRAIDESEEEVAAEKAQKEREAEERRQREMDRRARLEAEVQYVDVKVGQGHGLQTESKTQAGWAENVVVEMGKHKGSRVGQLESLTLQWYVKKMRKSKLGRASEAVLKARGHWCRLMPFGKQKGTPLHQLSKRQLAWLANSMSGELADEARALL